MQWKLQLKWPWKRNRFDAAPLPSGPTISWPLSDPSDLAAPLVITLDQDEVSLHGWIAPWESDVSRIPPLSLFFNGQAVDPVLGERYVPDYLGGVYGSIAFGSATLAYTPEVARDLAQRIRGIIDSRIRRIIGSALKTGLNVIPLAIPEQAVIESLQSSPGITFQALSPDALLHESCPSSLKHLYYQTVAYKKFGGALYYLLLRYVQTTIFRPATDAEALHVCKVHSDEDERPFLRAWDRRPEKMDEKQADEKAVLSIDPVDLPSPPEFLYLRVSSEGIKNISAGALDLWSRTSFLSGLSDALIQMAHRAGNFLAFSSARRKCRTVADRCRVVHRAGDFLAFSMKVELCNLIARVLQKVLSKYAAPIGEPLPQNQTPDPRQVDILTISLTSISATDPSARQVTYDPRDILAQAGGMSYDEYSPHHLAPCPHWEDLPVCPHCGKPLPQKQTPDPRQVIVIYDPRDIEAQISGGNEPHHLAASPKWEDLPVMESEHGHLAFLDQVHGENGAALYRTQTRRGTDRPASL